MTGTLYKPGGQGKVENSSNKRIIYLGRETLFPAKEKSDWMETLHFTDGVAQVIFSNISYYVELMSNYSLPVFKDEQNKLYSFSVKTLVGLLTVLLI